MKSRLNLLINVVAIVCLLWFGFIHGRFYMETGQIKDFVWFLGAAFIVTNKALLLPERSELDKVNDFFQYIKTIFSILVLISVGVVFFL